MKAGDRCQRAGRLKERKSFPIDDAEYASETRYCWRDLWLDVLREKLRS